MRLVSIALISLFTLFSAQGNSAENVEITACDTSVCKKHYKDFRKLARNGSPQAQLAIAGMYYSGYGVEKDVKESLNWYRKAAKHGGVKFATFRAGMIYLFDKDIEQDIDKGIEFLQRAAEAGHPEAAYTLANIYMGGKMVQKNMLKGFRYLEQGAKLGDPESLFKLGNYYEAGITGKKETAAAISVYKIAAKKLPAARERLAELAKEGRIDKRDDIFASTEDNGIEKITVTAPDLPELFDTSLASIKATGQFNNKKTCSRISSSPCGNQVVKMINRTDMQNMFDNVFMDNMINIAAMTGEF